jgi:hypothetical protein
MKDAVGRQGKLAASLFEDASIRFCSADLG